MLIYYFLLPQRNVVLEFECSCQADFCTCSLTTSTHSQGTCAVPGFVLMRSLVGLYITKLGLLEGVVLKLGPEFLHRAVQMAAHVNVALVRQAAQIESLELSLCEQLPATGVRVVL